MGLVGDENLNEWLVSQGYAFVFHKWSSRTKSYKITKTYLKQQKKAESDKRGLHAYSSLSKPHHYRHRKNLSRFKYPDCVGQ
jgi:endonuclease YncB( thermonuclease family)